MKTKERIEERIKELKEYIERLCYDFYGRDYAWYLEDEIYFLEQLLKELYLD